MDGFPSFEETEKCGNCGETTPQEAMHFSVPTCPDVVDSARQHCENNAGKFYDKTVKDLIVPPVGKVGTLFVCDIDLWATCQWIAICYGNNLIAIFKLIALNKAEKSIDIYNGCGAGKEISGNPSPGTNIKKGAVFYAIPPPWCSDELCKKIAQAIEDPDCACKSVASCLANSSEICLTSIPDQKGDENISIIGTVKGDGNDTSLWKKCLRLVKKIWSGLGGRTFCFGDMPSTNDAPVGDVSKHFVYLDENGCLKKGREVDGTQCDDDLDLQPVDSEDPSCNCVGVAWDKLWACKAGERVLIVPTDENQTIVSCKNDSDVLYWRLAKRGLGFHPLDEPALLSSVAATVAVVLPSFPEEDLPCPDSQVWAVFKTYAQTFPDGSAGAGEIRAFLNIGSIPYSLAYSGFAGDTCVTESRIKVATANNTILFATAAGTSLGFECWLLGYYY